MSERLDRSRVRKRRLSDPEPLDENFVPGTMEERIKMVWPLTKQLSAMSDKYDAERRLQRSVARVYRRAR